MQTVARYFTVSSTMTSSKVIYKWKLYCGANDKVMPWVLQGTAYELMYRSCRRENIKGLIQH